MDCQEEEKGEREMRITKVKATSNGVSIDYEVENKSNGYNEISLSSGEMPAPTFIEALGSLIPHVRKICEFPKSFDSRIKVAGVSFSYVGDEGTMGATIIATLALTETKGKLAINTPHRPSEHKGKEPHNPKSILSGDCVACLHEVQNEAEHYVKGRRQQTGLFDDSAAAK
jgi:hypothetical protein